MPIVVALNIFTRTTDYHKPHTNINRNATIVDDAIKQRITFVKFKSETHRSITTIVI